MAITKLMHMKSAKTGSASTHLKNAINYILKDKKVAFDPATQQQYAASQGCILNQAYNNMMQTKEQYGKTDGRQGYHFIISFRPREATKEQLWKITHEFVKEYLKGYEAVYAIHDDTDHLHAHIVFNSVNWETGYKYHYKNGDWEKDIQPIVDRLCLENGAPMLEYHTDEYDQDGVKKEFHTYSNNFNWTKEVKADIDECIKASKSWSDFIENMQQKGYSINYGKSISLRKAGMKKAKRLKEKTMGYEYTPEGIIERIHILPIIPSGVYS
ncbi:MAG: relaxase/mobilization nuclease domain-containing protein [Lachnospiraceae bacterium]|nr:relaxase/mobilization nuclease domain-containing protein [Lachnospiraceae bacterium]